MINYKQALNDNVESLYAENPGMTQTDLKRWCAITTALLHDFPDATPEDLSDELNVSEYSAEQLFKMVKTVKEVLSTKHR